jgi:hypothetical protein
MPEPLLVAKSDYELCLLSGARPRGVRQQAITPAGSPASLLTPYASR